MAANLRPELFASALVLLSTIAAGCGRRNPGAPDGTGSTANGERADAEDFVDASIRVSESDAREFAERLADAVNRADTETVAGLFDWDEIGRRATEGVELSEGALASFRRGMQQPAAKQLFREITQQIEQGGSYDFLRVHLGRGGRRLLFRVTSVEGMLNYHDVVVYRAASGDVMAADLHTAATGELLSETFRRMLLQIVAQENRTILQRLTGWQADYVKCLPQVMQLTTHVRQKQFQEALADYDQLPASLQRDKTILILRIVAAQNVGDAEYYSAVTKLVDTHPDDPSVGLYMIDAARHKGDLDGALRAVSRLEKSIGGDPYLDITRAALFVEKRDFAKAREHLAKVEEWEPNEEQTQWIHVSIALAERDFDEIVRRLRIITDDLNGGVADLTTLPEYAEFVKSPQYETWMKSREQSP